MTKKNKWIYLHQSRSNWFTSLIFKFLGKFLSEHVQLTQPIVRIQSHAINNLDLLAPIFKWIAHFYNLLDNVQFTTQWYTNMAITDGNSQLDEHVQLYVQLMQ